MNYWLMKSEPEEMSFEQLWLEKDQTVDWTGVRNYQARNFMLRSMAIGDELFFYHSSCEIPGIAGIARVCSFPHPDPTQFDATSPYYDARSSVDKPRWFCVHVQALQRTRFMPLSELRQISELEDMLLLRRGNRLSITPVEVGHWQKIASLIRV